MSLLSIGCKGRTFFDLNDNEELSRTKVFVTPDQLTRLYTDYRHLVFSVSWIIVRDSNVAEDITQDVFIKLQALDSIDHPAAWLKQVTKHLSLNYVRDEKRRSKLVDLHSEYIAPQSNKDIIEFLIAEDLRLECEKEIRKMPKEFRGVAQKLLDEYKPSEIQISLRIAAGTASSRIHRIRRKLSEVKKKTETNH